MVFSSIEFMFRFLPIFLIVYFAAAPKYRNIILLIGSLIFYGVGEPSYIILMILSILVNHFAAVNIYTAWKREDDTQASTETNRKVWLIAAMVFNFGMLFVFKYLNFFIGIINGIAGTTVLKLVSLTLPLGISFYTFQAASYVIDIYRRKYEIANGLLDFATYLCMFPQLIAGPIVSFSEVKDDLHKQRKISLPKIEWGTTIFVLGLAYKVLLANKIASLWNTVMTAGVMGIHPLTAWLGSWGFSMQLFFDFFGYSLMAIGLGRILGFKFPTNFKNPYCATSVHGFLAQMAYHTQQMVPGICLYPTGWKPQRAETYDSQYIYRVVTHRPVAWRGLELYYMGHVLLRAADRREVIFIGQAGTACDLIPYLYADRDSGFLDNLQHFRSANARKLYQAVIFPSSQGIGQNRYLPEVSGIVRHLLVAARNLRHLLYADSNPPVKAVLQDMGM